MLCDYHGFPDAACDIDYPAPGYPALAERAAAALRGNGIPVRIDPGRGFDHGLFIPLKLMYPRADIPAIRRCTSATAFLWSVRQNIHPLRLTAGESRGIILYPYNESIQRRKRMKKLAKIVLVKIGRASCRERV